MKKFLKYYRIIPIFIFLITFIAYAQKPDEAFYKKVDTTQNSRTILTFDFSKIQKPQSIEEFKSVFHTPPVRQDTTGTCWCFSATSFLESELKRLGKGEYKLSEMFTVYNQYIDKCRRYIKEKGNSLVDEGSEQNAVLRMIKKYGIVRESDYNGLIAGRTGYNNYIMLDEIKSYLEYIKNNNYWDEEKSLEYIKSILNKYLGEPPKTIEVDGKNITPIEFQEKILQIPLDDYVDFMSTTSIPFYTKGEYKVPDNWWHCTRYHNIPLDEYYQAIKNAIINGYSVGISGDVSEPGIKGDEDAAIIASFDCPQNIINQDSRELRFYNKTSTDDHAIHLVGYEKIGKNEWFLIKDSGGSGWKGKFKGYFFYRDDYVKLKMLAFLVHKDAVKDILSKFK
jgi:bleomycin hydrolase